MYEKSIQDSTVQVKDLFFRTLKVQVQQKLPLNSTAARDFLAKELFSKMFTWNTIKGKTKIIPKLCVAMLNSLVSTMFFQAVILKTLATKALTTMVIITTIISQSHSHNHNQSFNKGLSLSQQNLNLNLSQSLILNLGLNQRLNLSQGLNLSTLQIENK